MNSGPVLKRSCFQYTCPICNFQSDNDKHFFKHSSKHEDFQSFKRKYGSCEKLVGDQKMIRCFLCHQEFIHRASVVDRHLKMTHGLQWTEYVSQFKQQKEEIKTIDEADFRRRLEQMTRSKTSIEKIVKYCKENHSSAYKIVRSLRKVMIKSPSEHKLTLFYVHHELALVMSNNIDFNKRLAESILSLLPIVKANIPQSKIEHCLKVWKRCHTFEKNVVVQMLKIFGLETSKPVHKEVLTEHSLPGVIAAEVPDNELVAENVNLAKPPPTFKLAVDIDSEFSTFVSRCKVSNMVCNICDNIYKRKTIVSEIDFLAHLVTHYEKSLIRELKRFGSNCPVCGEKDSNIRHIGINHKVVFQFYKEDGFAKFPNPRVKKEKMSLKELISSDICINISTDSEEF